MQVKIIWVFICQFTIVNSGLCQERLQSAIEFIHDHPTSNVNNYFEVVAHQIEPVELHQLSAKHISYENRDTTILEIKPSGVGFIVNPKLSGFLEIEINIDHINACHKFRIRRITGTSKISH